MENGRTIGVVDDARLLSVVAGLDQRRGEDGESKEVAAV